MKQENKREEDLDSQVNWISKGFEELIKDSGDIKHYDVIIIGSGYGGSISAYELSNKTADGVNKLKVCVLERGKEYLSGMFPSTFAELPGHVRFSTPNMDEPKGETEGLFDFRLGSDVNVVVANGLGGGSLINAGVMEKPKPQVFEQGWPQEMVEMGEMVPKLNECYEEAIKGLGAGTINDRNTISKHKNQNGLPEKFKALQKLSSQKLDINGKKLGPADKNFRESALTIAMKDGATELGVKTKIKLNACKKCGDCGTGCNFGAKESLDINYLFQAKEQGAEIYTGATVLKLEKFVNPKTSSLEEWIVHTTYTDKKIRSRQSTTHNPTIKLKAKKVILAAGTLGSTEILLRSVNNTEQTSNSTKIVPIVRSKLRFSKMLGKKFSGNGDAIAAGYGHKVDVNASAHETQEIEGRNIGPTNMGIIDVDLSNDNSTALTHLTIEELNVPAPLRRVFEEIVSTSNTLYELDKFDLSQHRKKKPKNDPFSIKESEINRTQIYAVMGDDGAKGSIELDEGRSSKETEIALGKTWDSSVIVRWPGVEHEPLFDKQIKVLERLASKSKIGGRILANPIWKLLPDSMSFLMYGERGPISTVHPLGGCAMADHTNDGVVNHYGKVFDPDSENNFHDGLVVLDGSIIPKALSTNPALTIAAVSLYAIKGLCAEWNFIPVQQKNNEQSDESIAPIEVRRQEYRDAQNINTKPNQTKVRLVERLSGEVDLYDENNKCKKYWMEITIRTKPKKILELIDSENDSIFEIGKPSGKEKKSRNILKIYDLESWRKIEKEELSGKKRRIRIEAALVFEAKVEGLIKLFSRSDSIFVTRIIRAWWAWIRNRGFRDIFQFLCPKDYERDTLKTPDGPGIFKRFWNSLKLASRAGEIRLLEYELKLLNSSQGFVDKRPKIIFSGKDEIIGKKSITYSRCSNPWVQLQEISIVESPFVHSLYSPRKKAHLPRLKADLEFSARRGIAFFQIVGQQDQPTALMDLLSFSAYLIRLIVTIHIWSFRKPDISPPQEIDLLPGEIPGLPKPVIREIEVGTIPESKIDGLSKGAPVLIRLTRYPSFDSKLPPLLLIHGYSTSGTCFTHPSIKSNLVSYFVTNCNRDVWVLDLRTSSGLPSARYPWKFEDVADIDIPVAVDYIYKQTGNKPIDVLAHCMGAVMFSMSVLGANEEENLDEKFRKGTGKFLKFQIAKKTLPTKINKLVLSQAGPVLRFCPANIFRAYIISYLKDILPLDNYQFKTKKNPSVAEQLSDRLFSTIPYPDEEFKLENPLFEFWKRTPYTAIRHRMDALYGYTFKLGNLSSETLNNIANLFGPLNIETITQTIHFSKHNTVTNKRGRNKYFSQGNLKKHWGFETLCIHSQENGLLDLRTLYRSKNQIQYIKDKEPYKISETIECQGFGHQDLYLGEDDANRSYLFNKSSEKQINNRKEIFNKVNKFFESSSKNYIESNKPTIKTRREYNRLDEDNYVSFDIPWGGPVVVKKDTYQFLIGMQTNPSFGLAAMAVYLPVITVDDSYRLDCDCFNREGNIDAEKLISYLGDNELAIRFDDDNFKQDINGWIVCRIPKHIIDCQINNILVLLMVDQKQDLIDTVDIDNKIRDVNEQQWEYSISYLNADNSNPNQYPYSLGDGTSSFNDVISSSEEYLNKVTEKKVQGVETFKLYQMLEMSKAVADRGRTGAAISLSSDLTESSDLTGNVLSNYSTDLVRYLEEEKGKPNRGIININLGNDDPKNSLEFAIGSCQYPGGLFDSQIAYKSYGELYERAKPSFLILMGDQVYVDATAGLYDPATKYNRYHLPYEKLYRNRQIKAAFKKQHVYMMLDDHEIEDNWEPANEVRIFGKRFLPQVDMKHLLGVGLTRGNMKEPVVGISSGDRTIRSKPMELIDSTKNRFKELNEAGTIKNSLDIVEPKSGANVQNLLTSNFGNIAGGHLGYKFVENGFRFIFLDTRTKREHRSAQNFQDACILGEDQFENHLIKWLDEDKETNNVAPKFVISPSTILPRHSIVSLRPNEGSACIRSDSWDGYPKSLYRLLAHIVDNEIDNVIFLSGDEHISCDCEINITNNSSHKTISVRSIISSALYAPFPFANSIEEDLALNEVFEFKYPKNGDQMNISNYSCRVKKKNVITQNGFAIVNVSQNGYVWNVEVRFPEDKRGNRNDFSEKNQGN